MGFSQALKKVPQGGPKCANLKGTFAGSSWTAAANPSVVVRSWMWMGGLLAVSIEGVIHSHRVEASVDESGCAEPPTAGAKFDGDRSRVKGGEIASLLILFLER